MPQKIRCHKKFDATKIDGNPPEARNEARPDDSDLIRNLDELTIKSNLDEKDGGDGETLHGFCLKLMGDDLNTP
jgi:hypothetical protein